MRFRTKVRILLVIGRLWDFLKWITQDTEYSTMFALLISSVCFGMGLMVLEEMKNLIIAIANINLMWEMYAPLWGISYELPKMWDIGLLMCVFAFCCAMVSAYKLGKMRGTNK